MGLEHHRFWYLWQVLKPMAHGYIGSIVVSEDSDSLKPVLPNECKPPDSA